jgi:hypothetical protein
MLGRPPEDPTAFLLQHLELVLIRGAEAPKQVNALLFITRDPHAAAASPRMESAACEQDGGMPPIRVRPPGGIRGKEGAARRVKRLLLLMRPLFAITKRDEMGCPTRSDKSSSSQVPKDAVWEPVCHQFIRHLFAANGCGNAAD